MGVERTTSLWTQLRFGAVFAASAMVVLLARLWLAFWPPICLLLAYLGLAALGLFEHLDMAFHWLVIAVFAGAAAYATRKHALPFVLPTRAHIEHAMERAANLPHRPLAALRDTNTNKAGDAIWAQHQARMLSAKAAVKPARFDADVSPRDPFDLRHVAGLFFALALLLAGAAAPMRMFNALTPALPALPAASAPALDAWITPPAYTQIAPVYLARANNTDAQLTQWPQVPATSVLKIRISGHRQPPVVRIDGKRIATVRLDKRNYTAEATLTNSSVLTVRQGLRHLGRWDIEVIADQPPKLHLTDAGKGGNGLLKLTWQAGDDYGLTALTAHITAPDDMIELMDGARTTLVDLPLPARPQPGKKQDGVFSETLDLSRHLLSGSIVNVTLSAHDGAGQEVRSNTLEVTLPERRFTSALAQRVADERMRLFLFGKSWLVRDFASTELIDIVNRPDLYRGDRAVFMGLVSAIKRLGYDQRQQGITSVRDLLWDIALRIEDGGLSETSRELQEALADLSRALNNPETSEQELQELMGEVQQRMQEYMQAMANELQQRQQMQQQSGAAMPPEIADKVMQKIDLDALMQQMREMAGGDNRQAMRQMMDMLRNAVQNMDVDAVARMQKQQQEAMQALQGLGDVIRAQQELIDATAQADATTTKAEFDEMAAAQDSINQELQKLQGKLGPLAGRMQGDMNAAGDLMGLSSDRLAEQQRDNALAAQKNALKALMKAQDNAMQQLAEQMQQMMMLGMGGQRQGGFGEGFDPLGRESGDGKNIGGSIGLPDEGERRRVQDIQDELRERYNDSERPRNERDYLERLLDLFE